MGFAASIRVVRVDVAGWSPAHDGWRRVGRLHGSSGEVAMAWLWREHWAGELLSPTRHTNGGVSGKPATTCSRSSRTSPTSRRSGALCLRQRPHHPLSSPKVPKPDWDFVVVIDPFRHPFFAAFAPASPTHDHRCVHPDTIPECGVASGWRQCDDGQQWPEQAMTR
ncbi:hypothetical protein ACP4OV_017407 [Aristida adscensionis]